MLDGGILYELAGLGPVSPAPVTGAPAPASEPLARTTLTPAVTVGGSNADIIFSGLAPGFVGLYQVNVVIPAAAPAGAVPLVVSVSGTSSKTATIAVSSP